MPAHSTNTYKTALEQTRRVDLAIIGGGCAGLSLARELANRHTPRSVLIIEPRTQYVDDRSWCFWSPHKHALARLVSQRWTKWSFGRAGQPSETRCSQMNPYQYVRSIDFYQDCLNHIAQCPTIELKLGTSVSCMTKHEHAWHIETANESVCATEVLDTRPPHPKDLAQADLYQCFLGVELEYKGVNRADLSTLELMTDMRMLDGEFCFTYLLPLAQNRLLIELTLFATRPYAAEELSDALAQLLAERSLSQATVLRREYGNLPMGLPHSPSTPARAGIGGGALRASSGYGFLRIQHWAERCAEHFCKNDTVIAQVQPGFLPQKMDQLFLAVIKKQPALAPILFDKLLGQTHTERFIRFMNDRASLTDYFAIVRGLPKAPFIRALLSNIMQKKQ